LEASLPVGFHRQKASLLVFATDATTPPWGSWVRLSSRESERRLLVLSVKVNESIALEVDHIDFTTKQGDVLAANTSRKQGVPENR
jgi:hypothetical protein